MPFFAGRPHEAEGYIPYGHYQGYEYPDSKERDEFLMHGRTSDVHSEDGRRFLFGEETQADAQQKGNAEGYHGWNQKADVERANAELPKLRQSLKDTGVSLITALGLDPERHGHSSYMRRYLGALARIPTNPKAVKKQETLRCHSGPQL